VPRTILISAIIVMVALVVLATGCTTPDAEDCISPTVPEKYIPVGTAVLQHMIDAGATRSTLANPRYNVDYHPGSDTLWFVFSDQKGFDRGRITYNRGPKELIADTVMYPMAEMIAHVLHGSTTRPENVGLVFRFRTFATIMRETSPGIYQQSREQYWWYQADFVSKSQDLVSEDRPQIRLRDL
jgi:hypothetical protein